MAKNCIISPPPIQKIMHKRSALHCEHELVSLLKSNNKTSFEYLYDQYVPGLYGTVCKIIKDEHLANDVIQDSFIKIWKNIGQYDPEKGTLFTWMLNITRRTAIDRLRTGLKHNSTFSWEQISEDDYSAEAIINPLVPALDLRGLLEGLLPDKKKLIELVYFEGYTHQEACEHLGLPLGTVKSRIRKALIELRLAFDIPSQIPRFI
jgi:RNA polymerase sigma-70 factor (ECF subfamily)